MTDIIFYGFVLAVVFPAIRAYCKYKKQITPLIHPRTFKEDVANGFVLPQYIQIAFIPYYDDIHPNPTILIICVFYTMYLMIMDLSDNGRSPLKRTRADDVEVN